MRDGAKACAGKPARPVRWVYLALDFFSCLPGFLLSARLDASRTGIKCFIPQGGGKKDKGKIRCGLSRSLSGNTFEALVSQPMRGASDRHVWPALLMLGEVVAFMRAFLRGAASAKAGHELREVKVI